MIAIRVLPLASASPPLSRYGLLAGNSPLRIAKSPPCAQRNCQQYAAKPSPHPHDCEGGSDRPTAVTLASAVAALMVYAQKLAHMGEEWDSILSTRETLRKIAPWTRSGATMSLLRADSVPRTAFTLNCPPFTAGWLRVGRRKGASQAVNLAASIGSKPQFYLASISSP